MKPRSRASPLRLITTLLSFVHRPQSSIFAAAESASPKNASFNPLAGLQQFALSTYTTGNMTRLAPVISISHGGGPMPILGDPSHAAIVKSLKQRVPKILKLGTSEQPKAIVLVTAHWTTDRVTVSSSARHELLYDYYGFPDEAYGLKYDAPGSPEIAEEIERALKEEGISVKKDGTRGWDHGVFVPMMLINPKANVPIIQLSVLANESPAQHYALGRALHALRAQNIAIVGSGFASLHNLRAMFSGLTSTPSFKSLNEEWSRQVGDAVTTLDVDERGRKFEGWRGWKGAYDMHPRGGAEHFLPLIVCAGAAGKEQGKMYSDSFQGLDMWSYYWNGEE